MFHKSKVLLIAVSSLMILGLMIGCGNTKDDTAKMPDVIKVGFLGPLQGGNASEGAAARNSFQLVFDQVNAAKIFPYTIEVVDEDDAGKPETGATAAQKLTADAAVIAVSGHYNSPVAEATIPTFKQANCPLVIWGAVGENLTCEANYPLVTRICCTATQQSVPLADDIINKLGYKDIYIIADSNSLGQSATKAFQEQIKACGGNDMGLDEAQTGTTDYRSILAKVKSLKPQAIFYAGVAQEGGLIARQMKELGMNDILLFGISGICSQDFTTAAGPEAAEGVFSIVAGMDMNKTEAGKKFLDDYAAAGFREPIGSFSSYAYQAGEVIIQALKDLKGEIPTRENMIEAIKNSSTEGVLGNTVFNEVGQNSNPITTAMICQDGKWVEYETSEYANGTRLLAGKSK